MPRSTKWLTLLFVFGTAQASEANLSWTEPTHNEDGSLLTDLTSYEIHYGCTQSGVYGSVEYLSAPATAYTVLGLPDNGACYFAAKAVNSQSIASVYSNEATRVFGSPEVPGPVTDTAITWRESVSVGFAHTGSDYSSSNSNGGITVTHELTINDGDLVVAFINMNDAVAATKTGSEGAAWNSVVGEVPSGMTAWQGLWWKIASSEPSAYAWTWSGSRNSGRVIRVFSSTTDAEIDSAAATHIQAGTSNDLVAGAANGAVISDNSLSLIFAGKDARRSAQGPYTTVDNSYTGVIGDTPDQMTAAAYRIYTTGTTFSGDITIQTADSDDDVVYNTYSSHISFVESAAGGGAPENFLTLLGVGH